jgi:Fe-S cluster biogenesis protein NfuA
MRRSTTTLNSWPDWQQRSARGQRQRHASVFDVSESSEPHPLASELLAIDGVDRVMIARDFVTVVRSGPAIAWEALRPQIALVLAELGNSAHRDVSRQAEAPLGEVERHIEEVLDRYVRHLLAKDGGEAVLVRFDAAEGIAWVRMGGACGGCPSGMATLKRTIEQTIMRWVPEVRRVQSVGNKPTSLEDPKARFRNWVEAKWGKQRA